MGLETDEIIKSYFRQNNIIIRHQIDSFNYFIDEIIPNILSQFFPIKMTYNTENSVINNIGNINKLDTKYLSVIYSMSLRRSYGGMNGDMLLIS